LIGIKVGWIEYSDITPSQKLHFFSTLRVSYDKKWVKPLKHTKIDVVNAVL